MPRTRAAYALIRSCNRNNNDLTAISNCSVWTRWQTAGPLRAAAPPVSEVELLVYSRLKLNEADRREELWRELSI